MNLSADNLKVFGDESFDEKGQRVSAVAALIGTEKEWVHLVEKWTETTGGREFHAAEWETEYANHPDKEKHKENRRIYAELTKLIVESGLRGFGVAFDIASCREHFPAVNSEEGFYKCFADIVNACGSLAITEKRKIEEFTMDNRKGKEYNAGLIYQYFMQRPEWQRENIFLTSKLSFDNRSNPRIQIADLVARETMKFLDNYVGPVRRVMRGSLKALATANQRIQFTAYEGPYFKSWRDQMGELEKSSGTNIQEYAKWLIANKQPENWSSRFHFIIWLAAKDFEAAPTAEPTEFEKFDATVGRLLSVSHKELQKREKRYQKQRAKKKRAKT